MLSIHNTDSRHAEADEALNCDGVRNMIHERQEQSRTQQHGLKEEVGGAANGVLPHVARLCLREGYAV